MKAMRIDRFQSNFLKVEPGAAMPVAAELPRRWAPSRLDWMGTAEGMLFMIIGGGTWPDTTSFSAGPAPRYGMGDERARGS